MRILIAIAGIALAVVLVLAAFGLPVAESLRLLADGAFGSKVALGRTLTKATPLVLTGLAMTVAWRTAMYNIGGEGQYLLGAITGAAFAKAMWGVAPAAMSLAILVGSVIGGAAIGWFAGWLFTARRVEIVISTILLNFLVIQFVDWAVRGPLQERKGQLPLTDALPNEAMLLRLIPGTDLHSGVFLSLVAVIVVWVLLYRTRLGFGWRVVGANDAAARASGLDRNRLRLSAMAVSGALCGLAGGIDYSGVTGQIGAGFSQQWGFIGIPVALLGGLHPVGVLAAGLFFGALFAGSENLARFNTSGTTIVYVIQAVAVLGLLVANNLNRGNARKST
ncbi:MAG: hypothetical protein HONBIEJF_01918 [Fimbriimonadaceae bacterium]|nr:hypothetical protein [Fimbriimonadaceae bacterium]